ncbi:hypothetical protein JCM19046_3493 [Bacillus sp. JCM 19046]|nr:hypothetical protein JCM19045_4282 [Bacillus sp. JCM 19045]GAF18884.1 hypothetical protein JCM19046_3493 [Bacillus sp. JCM 19046]
MYRPTLRCDESYRDYLNKLFQATTLDRNQLIRAAIFYASNNDGFKQMLKPYTKTSSLPAPPWTINNHAVWLEQTLDNRAEGRDVSNEGDYRERTTATPAHNPSPRRDGQIRKEGAVHTIVFS